LRFRTNISAERRICFFEKVPRPTAQTELCHTPHPLRGRLGGDMPALGVHDDDFVTTREIRDIAFHHHDASNSSLGKLRARVIGAGQIVGENQQSGCVAHRLFYLS
jgi:hypothetical protein